jgi:CubicO group peptidase (beta-lactamase class C family)
MNDYFKVFTIAAMMGAAFTVSASHSSENHDLDQFLAEAAAEIKQAVIDGKVPGLAAAIVDRDAVLWQATYGSHPGDPKRRITADTVFSVQSISKNYAAVAIMLAVQDGKLDLDVPIKAYLPEFKLRTPFPEAPMELITLRHLLSHTAGFTHEAPVGNNFDASSPSFNAHVSSIADTWLRFPVGSRYAYSNLGIDLAAFILQEVVGIPFEQYVQERLLEPLDAGQSFVDTPERNGNCVQCTPGHHPMFSSLPDYIPLTASGGVRTSLEDAAKYVRFHLNGGSIPGRQLLRPELLHELYRPTHREQAFGDHTVFPEHLFHGMGTYSFEEAGTYGIGHTGGGFGFTASMRWLPEYGIGMVILFNSGADPLAHLELGWELLARMVEKDLVQKVDDAGFPAAQAFFGAAATATSSDEDRPRIPGDEARLEGRLKELLGVHRPVFGGGFKLRESVEQCFDCIKIEQLNDRVVVHRGQPEPETLIRHAEGLYFADRSGELLDLRGDQPTWRSVGYRPYVPAVNNEDDVLGDQ